MANFSRRGFLQLVTLGTATGAVLAACKGGESGAAGGGGGGGGGLVCNDLTGLSASDKQLRNTLGYVDHTPQPEKTCDNCNFFVSKGENVCGGCTIMKGPVAPKGYCNSWVQKVGAPG